MGADARGIGHRRDTPCVGDPVDWSPDWMTCGAEGAFSLLTLVDSAAVADVEFGEPVLVHVTACRDHVRAARAWLRTVTDEEIDTYATDYVMEHWKNIQQAMAPTPVLRMVRQSA